jgi:hypothetical protein
VKSSRGQVRCAARAGFQVCHVDCPCSSQAVTTVMLSHLGAGGLVPRGETRDQADVAVAAVMKLRLDDQQRQPFAEPALGCRLMPA